MLKTIRLLIVMILLIFQSCTKKETLFSLQDNQEIGVDFINQLQDTKGTNIFSYRNYYNGGGVAIGDVNNDGLNDVYLTSNQGDNQLLINQGNFKFKNTAETAGVKGTKYWSTGVVMVDINADGWLDIYLCNSGNANGSETENELFINQKNGSFTEQAKEFGLADKGLSTHAAFFDYDLDGDLDCYVLNNSFRPIESFDFTRNLRDNIDEIGGDRLYRNNKGHFENVTEHAAIYSSDIGFGLGVSVADINQDGYPDIYVSNDFFERDYLYINQKNGTFKEEIQSFTGHLSVASMGSDIADINNDGQYDIFTTEMLPADDKRLKTMTSFENYDILKSKQHDGYYNQYMQNCLQLNNGDGTFSEIAFNAGVAATDWSWGALFFDMDNDGWRDIFVSNGIYKDLTNQDYIEFLGNRDNMEKIAEGKKFDFGEFTQKMNSTPLSNYAFINNKNLTFTNKADALGLGAESFSNGAAYGDLDNDGDDDLVVNNVNMPVFFYKNNTDNKNRHYLQLKLKGDNLNRNAVGSTVKTYSKGLKNIYYHQPARGFQSSISPNLITIGLGKNETVDSIQIIWPNNKFQTVSNLKTDSAYTFHIANAITTYSYHQPPYKSVLKENTAQLFDSVPAHKEDDFIDFDNERLMLQMLSTENPILVNADVNKDGLTDFYMSSSKSSSAAVYIQQLSGKFKKRTFVDFEKQSYLENGGAVFSDFDKDGDEDLIVCFGGNEEKIGSRVLFPRFFENDGNGNFKRNPFKNLPVELNAAVIISSDYDHDGDADVFLGARSEVGTYGCSPASYVLQNDGRGNFANVSQKVFGRDNKLGMVTDAKWADLDNDGFEDLIVLGNWMGIKIYKNNKGKFAADNRLENYKGWWSSLQIADIDKDGYQDIIAGNLGLNSKFRASEKEPMAIFIKDFDNNGTKECVTSIYKEDHKNYVFHLKQDLVWQLPSLKKRFLKYEEYAGKTFEEVFKPEMLKDAETHHINTLKSCAFFNKGNKTFEAKPLPYHAQLSAINSILVDDIDADGKNELILAGNFFGFKPEVGRLDAGYGQVYKFNKGDFLYMPPLKSGIRITGQVTSSSLIKNKSGVKTYLFGRNNDKLIAFTKR